MKLLKKNVKFVSHKSASVKTNWFDVIYDDGENQYFCFKCDKSYIEEQGKANVVAEAIAGLKN